MFFKLLGIILINSMSANSLKSSKIIGGEIALIEDFPHQVSLQYYQHHFCGGSIISTDWVLTAAHCLKFPKEAITVYAGSNHLHYDGYHYHVDLIKVHENFEEKRFIADLALIKVAYPFRKSSSIQPILLFNQNEFVQPNKKAITSGWGEGNKPAHLLHKVNLFIVSKEYCALAYYMPQLPPGQICAGIKEGGKDGCQGDSGGPLVVDGRLAGVVSWGFGCGIPNIPGVYTEVGEFRNWIDRNMARNNVFYY